MTNDRTEYVSRMMTYSFNLVVGYTGTLDDIIIHATRLHKIEFFTNARIVDMNSKGPIEMVCDRWILFDGKFRKENTPYYFKAPHTRI
jgi:hypothetical protein